MTDLQQTLLMFSESNESFEKKKSGKEWTIILPERGIKYYFNSDESFHFICKY